MTAETTEGSVDGDISTGLMAGLLRQECVFCAERVPPVAQLRGEACPHCARTLDATRAIPGLLSEIRRRARHGYVYAAGVGAIAGSLPFLLPIVLAASVAVARFRFIRPLLRLLAPLRRLHYRLSLALVFGLSIVGTLSLVPTLTFLPVLNILLGAAAVGAATAVYVEAGIWGLGRALDAEWVSLRPLTALHWVLPGLLLALLSSIVLMLALLIGVGAMLLGGGS